MSAGVLDEVVRRHTAGPRPAFTAAQILVLVDGEPIAELVHGVEQAYSDADGAPAADQVPVTTATRFDIASVTKLLTAALLLEELADHGLGLESRVRDVLPEYRGTEREDIRFRHLLAHTAGLPPTWGGWRAGPGPEQARAALLALAPGTAPGTVHAYSCIGYLHAGFAIEALAGEPLDAVLRRRIAGPLRLAATGYRPERDEPVAATEWQERPRPGITRGAVHDETARALGGVAGNAGVFATARDLARFGEELRTGAHGVLRETVRTLMQRPIAPAGLQPAYEQAAGPRLADSANFGRLADGGVGHTGFTGTMLLMHPARRLSLVALTNRVHPNREWSDPSVFRRDLADAVIELIA
ncbi:MAG: beta-lactamase family protein [Microbacteriaceae bacterium]|nr:beta-lactamase family protein [Microbacteriaceae bacterium]